MPSEYTQGHALSATSTSKEGLSAVKGAEPSNPLIDVSDVVNATENVRYYFPEIPETRVYNFRIVMIDTGSSPDAHFQVYWDATWIADGFYGCDFLTNVTLLKGDHQLAIERKQGTAYFRVMVFYPETAPLEYDMTVASTNHYFGFRFKINQSSHYNVFVNYGYEKVRINYLYLFIDGILNAYIHTPYTYYPVSREQSNITFSYYFSAGEHELFFTSGNKQPMNKVFLYVNLENALPTLPLNLRTHNPDAIILPSQNSNVIRTSTRKMELMFQVMESTTCILYAKGFQQNAEVYLDDVQIGQFRSTSSFGGYMTLKIEPGYHFLSHNGLFTTVTLKKLDNVAESVLYMGANIIDGGLWEIVTSSINVSSPHPYPNDYNYTWNVSHPGTTSIRVFFDKIDTETGHDYVSIYDRNDSLIKTYDGLHVNTWSPWISGDAVKIRLTSDSATQKWGFHVSTYQVDVGKLRKNILELGSDFSSTLAFSIPSTGMYNLKVSLNIRVNQGGTNYIIVDNNVTEVEVVSGTYTDKLIFAINFSAGIHMMRMTSTGTIFEFTLGINTVPLSGVIEGSLLLHTPINSTMCFAVTVKEEYTLEVNTENVGINVYIDNKSELFMKLDPGAPLIKARNLTVGVHTIYFNVTALLGEGSVLFVIRPPDFKPPLLSSPWNSPLYPTNNTDVTVSINITDDSQLYFVQLYYSLDNETTWIKTSMNIVVGNQFSGIIPKQSVGTYVVYYVEAQDIFRNLAKSSKHNYTVISMMPSQILIECNPMDVVFDNSTKLSGSIVPVHVNASVNLMYTTEGASWINIGQVETLANGTYSYVWTPPSIGVYTFKANWTGDFDHKGSESENCTAVVKYASKVFLNLNPTEIVSGDSINITGSLTPPLPNVTITIYYRISISDSWDILDIVKTNTTGGYTHFVTKWTPPSGGYEIKASWHGNSYYWGAESKIQTLSVSPALFVYIVASPTTVLSGRQLMIVVNVTDGTTFITDATVSLSSSGGGRFSYVSNLYNGTYTATFTAPTVTQDTNCTIIATASKYGYQSGQDEIQVKVTVLSLSVSIEANPTAIESDHSSTITIHITDGIDPVSDAKIVLKSDIGGSFSSTSHIGSGTYKATFTAPNVSTETNCTITVEASKVGYESGLAETQIVIKPPSYGNLHIYVQDTEGNPIGGAVVKFISQPSGQSYLIKTTNKDGFVAFDNVRTGSYDIEAHKDQTLQTYYFRNTKTVVVKANETTTETIFLEHRPTYTLYIIGAVIFILFGVVAIAIWRRKRHS